MSAACDRTAEQITQVLGFSCHHPHPVVTFRSPADLANWTLPVLEFTIIAGATFALVHAVSRLRRQGDPTNLALWLASLVYLFVTEPPLYFPGWFGLQDAVGLVFVHNVFTVQFMFDRLPLYIVAIYPALSQLAYELVRGLGIFRRRGPLVGAVCVALVYQSFYEIFDQLGPQLKWWAWNLDNPANHPLLASVPVNSIVLFSSVSSGLLVYLIVRLVGVPTAAGHPPRRGGLLWRILVAGALVPVGMTVASIPTAVFGGKTPNVTAQAVVLTVELVLLWFFAGITLWRARRRASAENEQPPLFVKIYPAAYLAVFGALWLSALPAALGATGGITSQGTPIGNLPYTALCFAAAGWVVWAVLTQRRPGEPPKHVSSATSGAQTRNDRS